MSNVIRIKRSSTPGAVPTVADLLSGELAINLSDRKLYTKNHLGAIVEIGEGGGGGGAQLWFGDSATPPPTTNYFWYNTDTDRLYIYYDDGVAGQWVDASPPTEENAIIFAIALG